MCSVFSSGSQAAPLRQELTRMLGEHHLIQAADADVAGARAGVGVARSEWFPKLSLDAQGGQEEYDYDSSGSDGSFSTHQEGASLEQLVWDFGAANAAIDKAGENLKQNEARLEAQRQDLLLAGIEAYVNLKRARQVGDYAQLLVESMTTQSRLEQARISSGRGYTADLLQAQSQQEGANARKAGAEGGLQEALHRYQAVFGERAVAVEELETVGLPGKLLPQGLEALIQAALQNNPNVVVAQHAKAAAGYEVERTRAAEWFPQVGLVAQARNYHDAGGSTGDWNSGALLVQANWGFDLGLKNLRAVDGAESAARAVELRAANLETQVREESRNAWNRLETAREQSRYLREQTRLAEEFLKLARKERELGRRSLLDVLNGETQLFTAQSEAINARANEVIAAYRVLRMMGGLGLEAVPHSDKVAAADHSRSGALLAADASAAKGDGAEAVVGAVIREWAAAWSGQQVERYLEFYSAGFSPPAGVERSAWVATRSERIRKPETIAVEVSQLAVELNGAERARATFVQEYRSDSYRDATRKQLELVKEAGGWKIVAERSGG